MNFDALNDILQNKNFIMFLYCITFMLGIFTFFSHNPIIIALIFSLLLVIIFYLKIFTIKKIIALILIFYLGYIITFIKVKNYDDLVPLAPINSIFQGRIVSIPNSGGAGKTKFILKVNKVDSQNISGKTLVMMPEVKNTAFNIGDKIEISGSLRIPFKSTNPSQFDYGSYLKNFNIYSVLYVNDEDTYKIISEKQPAKWKFMNRLNKMRTDILKVHSKYLKSPNLEILGGIVFGDDAVPPPEYIKKSFVNSGLLHILAASGMNVGFIFAFWVFMLKRLKIPYRTRILSGMLIVILYTLMTGLGPSVIRAALMLLFVLAGKLIDRDAHSVSLLSLVAVLMLIYNPAYLNDVSFQLSFFVTFGLITTAQTVMQKFPSAVPDWVKAMIVIPVIAQIWVVPIQMFYFNTISLYAVFANIISSILLSVISFMGFLSSILAIIKPIADIMCMSFDFILNYFLITLISISDFFGSLPHCIIQTTHPNIFQILIYYTMLLCATYLIKFDKYKKALCVLGVTSLILLCTTARIETKDLTITAFDVQNADCFLIKTPEQKYFFIDTGKAPYKSGNSQAKIIMLKYLADNGIKDIEGVVVTHFDNDHSGGVVDIISNTNVKTLYLNSQDTETMTARNIFKTAKEINQNLIIAQNNKVIYKEPDFVIKTYKADAQGKNKSNENSILTLVTYKKFNMLFMGDGGIEAYEQIKGNLPTNIEILKVGHHGGPNVVNERMINELGIKTSLISTGTNHFGHPNKGTLDVLRDTNIIRTDYLNSIKLSTKGNEYNIYSYNPQKKKYLLQGTYYSK